MASEEAPARRILIYGVQEENGSHVQNFALDLTPPPEVIYKSEPGTSDGMNVLGIVIFSATMGTCCPPPERCPGASPSLQPRIQYPQNLGPSRLAGVPSFPLQQSGSRPIPLLRCLQPSPKLVLEFPIPGC